MDSRVTLQSIVQGALSATSRLSNQLATLQLQASTGKKFSKVSDDPSAALAVLQSEMQAQSIGVHVDNISTATSTLNASVSTLQGVSDIFSQARSLAIEGSSAVNDGTSFDALAHSVNGLLERLVNLANTQSSGTYLYSGAAVHTVPFVVAGTDAQGQTMAVQYQGATNATSSFVDRAQQVALDYAGDQVFQTRERQNAVFTGATGAKPGTGTDTAVGRADLLIKHTATTYAAGSGVQAGTSSAVSDTILGPAGAHTLHVTDTSGNGSAGTVSLDGGPAVAFTSGDTDLKVANAVGDVVYIDTSAVTANFDGNVDITSAGSMSLDNGVTSSPINFAANEALTDAAGNITYVDTTNVSRTGKESINYPGTYDAFQALIALRDDLSNTRGLSAHAQIDAISADIGELQRVHDSVLTTVGTQSATLQSMQSLQSHLQDLQLNAQKTASDLGDVDMSQLVVQLQSLQNMMQLSLATFSRVIDQNLLDFLK